MKTLISIDPGQSTGLIVGIYSGNTPFELTHAFQIEGGVEGFVENVGWDSSNMDLPQMWVSRQPGGDLWPTCQYSDEITILVEKFNARGTATGPFSLKTNALEPLRVEGALIAMGVPITWVQPPQQYFLSGKDKAEKKKRQHAWLKENGLYIAPKDVGCGDADDARSATAHAISWLRRQKHKPTLDLFR